MPKYSLTWNYPERSPSYFLVPDRLEHIGHDVPDGYNIRVVTTRGERVCGRVVSAEAPWMELTLDPAWTLKIPPAESELVAARAAQKPEKNYVEVWNEWLAVNAMKLNA